MTENRKLPVLEVPELPTEHPCLLFTPDEVQRMKENRDTYAWARHAYYEALLMAERINRPTPAGGDDVWMVNPMDFTDKGRQREHLYSSFCCALIGYLDDDEKYLRRAFETMAYAFDEAMERWWQPASFYITLAMDGFWPVLSDDERKRMEALLRRAAEKSLASKARSNQGAGFRKAIVGQGILLHDRDLISEALNDGDLGSVILTATGIMDDGFWHETSPSYHHYGLTQLVETAFLCEKIGIDFKNVLDQRVLEGCRASFGLLSAQLGYPGTGDTHQDALGNDALFELAVYLYNDPWCGWALRQGSRSTYYSLAFGKGIPPHEAPPADSKLYPSSGFAALRAGDLADFWGSDGLTAYLRFGPHGGWHGHKDSVQMELRAYGAEMVTDSRRASRYRDYEHYGWKRTTLAHSTVVVDKRDQEHSPEQGGDCLHFLASGKVSASCVENLFVYPQTPHYRRSAVLTDRYLIDCFEVGSKYDRTYHYVLHGEGTYTSPLISREIDSLGRGHGYDFLAGIRGGDIVDHWEATLAQGSWDSHIWRPTGTGMRVRSIEPMPGRLYAAKALHGKAHGFEDCLIIETYGREKRFLNYLEPYRDEPKLTSLQSHPCNGLFLVEVEYEDGRDLIFYSPAERGTFEFKGYTFEGRFLFLKLDAEDNRLMAVGSDALSLVCGGTELHASGEGQDFDRS